LEEIAEAHRLSEAGHVRGKLVVMTLVLPTHYLHHQLPSYMPSLTEPMRFSNFFQWKHLANYWTTFPASINALSFSSSPPRGVIR